MTIWWDDLDGPHGAMRAAVTDAGLVRLTLPGEDRDLALRVLAARRGVAVRRDPAALGEVRDELEGYFAGRLRAFTLPVDLEGVPGFRRQVLDAMARIPFGGTLSYAALAAEAGRPRAVRAAGTACATNPVPIVVPCHRVLRSDGTLGRYGGGTDLKRALLAHEGVRPPAVPVAVP